MARFSRFLSAANTTHCSKGKTWWYFRQCSSNAAQQLVWVVIDNSILLLDLCLPAVFLHETNTIETILLMRQKASHHPMSGKTGILANAWWYPVAVVGKTYSFHAYVGSISTSRQRIPVLVCFVWTYFKTINDHHTSHPETGAARYPWTVSERRRTHSEYWWGFCAGKLVPVRNTPGPPFRVERFPA